MTDVLTELDEDRCHATCLGLYDMSCIGTLLYHISSYVTGTVVVQGAVSDTSL